MRLVRFLNLEKFFMGVRDLRWFGILKKGNIEYARWPKELKLGFKSEDLVHCIKNGWLLGACLPTENQGPFEDYCEQYQNHSFVKAFISVIFMRDVNLIENTFWKLFNDAIIIFEVLNFLPTLNRISPINPFNSQENTDLNPLGDVFHKFFHC